jgi:hypothetical protein
VVSHADGLVLDERETSRGRDPGKVRDKLESSERTPSALNGSALSGHADVARGGRTCDSDRP